MQFLLISTKKRMKIILCMVLSLSLAFPILFDATAPSVNANSMTNSTNAAISSADNNVANSSGSAISKVVNTSVKYKKALSGTAGKVLTDVIQINPGFGTAVHLQKYENGKWKTKSTYYASNTQKASLNMVYPKSWYEKENSSWRIYIPERKDASAFYSDTIKVKAKRVYQNPSKYLQISQTVSVSGKGNYNLTKGRMGLKVAKVQRKLGMGRTWEQMNAKTIRKVKQFQRKKNLKVTGVVDYKTWRKLGLSKSSWTSLGKYVTPVKVKMTSSRKDHIETMIKTAYSYKGTEYIAGASGKPGTGVDCSGLTMQCLYSAGLNPAPVGVIRHSKAKYRFESRNLWKHPKIKHVSYSKRKRGDLIFYSGKSGVVNHVAIYLGNNKVIEAWPDRVIVQGIKSKKHPYVVGVARPFV